MFGGLCDVTMGSISELQTVKRTLEDRILQLEKLVAEKDALIEQLTSKLDQYQSVIRIAVINAPLVTGGGGPADTVTRRPRKLRALGISAEPLQNVPRTLDDFAKDTFVTYPKSDRYNVYCSMSRPRLYCT